MNTATAPFSTVVTSFSSLANCVNGLATSEGYLNSNDSVSSLTADMVGMPVDHITQETLFLNSSSEIAKIRLALTYSAEDDNSVMTLHNPRRETTLLGAKLLVPTFFVPIHHTGGRMTRVSALRITERPDGFMTLEERLHSPVAAHESPWIPVESATQGYMQIFSKLILGAAFKRDRIERISFT
jgi:hypothetical protein